MASQTNQIDTMKNIVQDLKQETSWATTKTALLCEKLDAEFWKCQEKEKFTQEFCDCGGAELLVSILQKFEEDDFLKSWETAFIIYNCLCNLSEASLSLSIRLGALGMVKLCAHNIVKYGEKMNLKDIATLVRISLSILCNLSTAPNNRTLFREEGVAEKMQPYLAHGGDPFLRTICMITLGYIAEEGQESLLADQDQETDTTAYLVTILRDALRSPDRRYKGLCDREIVLALGRLALHNESNKCKIIDAEGLPLLVELLKSENRKTQEATANLIRSLAFSDVVRAKLVEHGECTRALQLVSQSEDSKVSDAAKGALWDIVALVGICASIIYGMSVTRDNPDLLNAEDLAEKMQAYLTSDPFLNTLCKITRVYVAEEGEEYNSPEQRTDTTEFLIRILRDALQSPDRKHKGLHDHEIVLALGRLAVQDHNKCKIVEAGALPLLEKLQESQNSHTQEVATNILRNLALSGVVGQKLVEHEDCMRGLESASQSRGYDESEDAKEAL